MTDEELQSFRTPNTHHCVATVQREMLLAEVERLRGLLKKAADDNEGAVSGHCCLNCPWCDGENLPYGGKHANGYCFEHAADCPAFNPDGTLR